MDPAKKKTALRMIPYGLYVLTSKAADGSSTAATVNWVTQASFEPPLVVVGVKTDSNANTVVRKAKSFALNILGKGQGDIAYAYFKPIEDDGKNIGGQPYHKGITGAPILEVTPAFVECEVVEIVDKGDHAIVVGKVVDAGVSKEPEGRADDTILWMKDLGPKLFYGG